MKHKKPIQLTAAAHLVTASTEGRTIDGVITVLDKLSDDRRVTFKAGSLTPREPIKRVKLLVDHDMAQPVGYMASFDQSGPQLKAGFYVPEGAAGDAALADAASGRRDGFSVGVSLYEYDFDDDGNLMVSSGQIHEVSLCAIPAFQDAQVENVAAMLAARKEPTMTPEETAAPPVVESAAAPTPAPAAPAEPVVPAPARLSNGEGQGDARHFTKDRGISLSQAAARVSTAVATGNPNAIHAALDDVIPANDVGKGWLRDSWLGEVWTAARTDRPWIDALGPVLPLTAYKVTGWQWDVQPEVAKWAGNKTEVPTNSPTTKKVEFTAERWAAAWDIDRIFMDLGEAGFLESFWRASMARYKLASDKNVGVQLLAGATDKGTSLTTLAAIKATARDLIAVGGTASTIFLGLDAFDEYADLTQAEVPHWLANVVGGVDIAKDTASVGSLTIKANADLAPDVVIGFDKNAADVYEKTPIRVQAMDVAKGGLDLGFFSYGMLGINDPRAVVKRTVGAGE